MGQKVLKCQFKLSADRKAAEYSRLSDQNCGQYQTLVIDAAFRRRLKNLLLLLIES
jgi:hypothetical protein